MIDFWVLGLLGVCPLVKAWWVNRATSLRYAIAWSFAAWLAWAWVLLESDPTEPWLEPVRFLALGLTGAAGVAVLGARRPYFFAWNFVVLGLVAVMLLPLVESRIIGTNSMDLLRIAFLGAVLAVGLLNYLPTRSAPVVVLLAAALGVDIVSLFRPISVKFIHLLVLLAPWAVWGCWWGARPAQSEYDRLWLDFRDRFGLFWSQRVRDQFNAAAAHAGWPVYLRWRGLHRTGREAIAPADQQAMLDTLRKALQRFM